MEGLAIRASRPSVFCSTPGLGGDSHRKPPSDGFLKLPASSTAAENRKLVANSASFHPISAINVSAQASLTADFPALSGSPSLSLSLFPHIADRSHFKKQFRSFLTISNRFNFVFGQKRF